MKNTTLTLLLQLAGLVHLGLIAAGLMMPRAVNLRSHLDKLPDFIRKLFWVYYTFIGLCLICFGAGSLLLAEELAGGTTLARATCAFLAVFWSIRLFAAAFVFDVSPYLINRAYWLGYQLTNIVFALLPVIYALAAWKGGAG